MASASTKIQEQWRRRQGKCERCGEPSVWSLCDRHQRNTLAAITLAAALAFMVGMTLGVIIGMVLEGSR